MSEVSKRNPGTLRMRLPATSANLGPGFDAAAIALDFYLDIEATPAEQFSITATGRDWERCSRVEDNLIVGIYTELLQRHGSPIIPLAIRMKNEIPLGMGCGSSAAGRLAAVALAVHFGELGWSSGRIHEEGCILEGHPDNISACWLGGFVTAASDGRRIHVAKVVPPSEWRAIVVLPTAPLPTRKARSLLPATYPMSDVVTNIQSAALLGLAFAQSRGDLLRLAMNDRIHQPYRSSMCPLLPRILPLAGKHGILGVALSGAGPGVLAIVGDQEQVQAASAAIRGTLDGLVAELVDCRFSNKGACELVETAIF
jgi:homoserine kinase